MQRVDVKGSAKGRCKRQTQHTDAQSGRLSMALCIDAFSVLMSLAGYSCQQHSERTSGRQL